MESMDFMINWGPLGMDLMKLDSLSGSVCWTHRRFTKRPFISGSVINRATYMRQQKRQKLPAKQRDYEVGDCKPPEEHQFQPGQSGNPKGPPKRRTQLWVYINQFMEMTDARLKKASSKRLTQAQQIALKLVESAKAGEGCGSERLARYCIDRDEGKATEHLVLDKDNDLTDDECDQIRKTLLRNHVDGSTD